jgi:hypothetical protein
VSRARWHFIVPAEAGPDSLADAASLPALVEARAAGRGPRAPRLPPPREPAAPLEAAAYTTPATPFDSSRHRLHLVLHSNGHGHLARVNGREGGSRALAGAQLAALAVELADGLRARRLTTEDASTRGGAELRVLLPVAVQKTWYTDFGFRFARGAYGVTEARWRAAAAAAGSAGADDLLADLREVEPAAAAVVARWRLPAGHAVRAVTLDALLYRLLYLQDHPGEAAPFFDAKELARAEAACVAQDAADARSRHGARAGGGAAAPAPPPPAAAGQKIRLKLPPATARANGGAGGAGGPPPRTPTSPPPKRARASEPGPPLAAPAFGAAGEVAHFPMELARNDALTRARQLARALRALVFAAAPALKGGDTRATVEAGFEAACGRAAPRPEWAAHEWWSFLPELFAWAAGAAGGGAAARARAAGAVRARAGRVEVDLGALAAGGLFPAAWPIPLSEAGVRRGNAAGAAAAAAAPRRPPPPPRARSPLRARPPPDAGRALSPPPATRAAGRAPGGTVVRLKLPAGAPRAQHVQQAQPAPRVPGGGALTDAQRAAVEAALAPGLAPAAPPMSPRAGAPAAAAPPPWMALHPGGVLPQPLREEDVRAQVRRDLQHLYAAVLGPAGYAPEIARAAAVAAAAAAGERAPVLRVRLGRLAEQAQALRDAKHFERLCTGETAAPPPPPRGAAPVGRAPLRVWARLAPPRALAAPPAAATRAGGRKHLPVDPPRELLTLPAGVTLGAALTAAADAFQEMYRACGEAFVVTAAVGGLAPARAAHAAGRGHGRAGKGRGGGGGGGGGGAPHCAPPPPDPAARLADLLPAANGNANNADGSAIPTLTLTCEGFDPDPRWLHAGGPEDWVVACACGTRDDDGAAMVECDACGAWAHARCAGLPEDGPAPAWQCEACRRRRTG